MAKNIPRGLFNRMAVAAGTTRGVSYILASILVPAADVGGAGNSGYANGAGGSLTPDTIGQKTIFQLFSFGENWLRLSVGESLDELFGSTPIVRFPEHSTLWTTLQDMTASSYSYGGTITGIQAYLNGQVGNSVPFEITTGAAPLGSNIVVNGTFDTADDWQTNDSSIKVAGGLGTFTSTPNSKSLYQTVQGIVGKQSYFVEYDIVNYVSGQMRLSIGGNTPGEARGANGSYSEIILVDPSPTSPNINLITIGTSTLGIDNVSVRRFI